MTRFAIDNTTDRGAAVWIATLLSLIYSCLVLIGRFYFRSLAIGPEDVVLLTAQLIACGEFGASMLAIEKGIAITPADASLNQGQVVQAWRAAQILYIAASATSKVSMTLLVKRIFSQLQSRQASTLCFIVAACSGTWGVVSILAITVDCAPKYMLPLLRDDSCSAPISRFLGTTIVDCLCEAAIIGLTAFFCVGLQMSSLRKAKVIFVFAFRLGCIVFSAVLFSAYRQVFRHPGELAPRAEVLIWQQVALCYALISATIPVSLKVMGEFSTGASVALGSSQKYRNTSHSSYGKMSLSRKSKPSISAASEEGELLANRAPWMGNSTTVLYSPGETNNVERRDMAILRQDTVTLTKT